MIHFSTRKVGGIRFIKIGRLTVSLSVSKVETKTTYEKVCLNPSSPDWIGKTYQNYAVTTTRDKWGRVTTERRTLGTIGYPPKDLATAQRKYREECAAFAAGF